MPSPDALRSLVDRYCTAVTSRDVDAVAALFTEDAVQADPANTPPNVGREAIHAFFTSAVEASEATRFEALAVHTCGNQVAIDFKVTVTLESGNMVISGIEVFTVTDDDRISAVAAYWDDADVSFA
jgi:steroid delta-isomerase